MTSKIYKSAQGKSVDLGALILQNENVRAVGNMGVNARGDLIDSSNRVIDQRNRQVQKQYKKQTSSTAPASAPTPRKTAPVNQPVLDPEIDFDEPVVANAQDKKINTESKTEGLAGAMARSRSNKK